MEKGLLSKRFVCEHRNLSHLDEEMIRNLHRTLHQEVRVAYSFSNLDERCVYSVIDSHDRLTVEAFFSGLRIPCSMITEVDLQCEGRGRVEDLRETRKAA